MLYSHRFSRPETLDRAAYWLTRLGIDGPRIRIDHQAHALSLHVGLGEIAKVDSVINALELSERDDRAADWSAAWKEAAERLHEPEGITTPSRSPIGWHADADLRPVGSDLDAVSEAIRRSE